MIEIRNADVVKSGVRLFQHFNWHVQAGEHWVITGSNGSGKTTLLEIIAGVTHLARGEIQYDFIKGDSWDERYAARKKKILYVPAHAFQTFLHDPGMYYQQRYYGIGDERVPLVSDILGGGMEKLESLKIPISLSIDQLLALEVNRLSNGQLKKVLFIKGLLSGIPRVLIMDYPFEGLDRESRRDLCDFIDFLAAAHGIQMMLVDHHHDLPRVMNRKLTMENFSILKEETLSEKKESIEFKTVDKQESFHSSVPVIEIRNLKIQYGNKVIIHDFNWTVHQGERWALVGRNGAGKTTLFSMIFADHPLAYSQDIHLFGKRRGTGESIWDIKRRINYIGSELINYLNPDSILLTAQDYIRAMNRKLSEKTLMELIAHFQGEHFMVKPVRFLSSGQLQLMMLINYFLQDKELLLLDEPFQFLDKEQRIRVSRFLQSHMHKDTTLILITHDEQDLTHWAEKTMRI